MWKKVAAAIVVLLVAMLAFAATKPDTFRVQRSMSIKAPPAKIVAFIQDFHGWAGWSPWEKLDPAMKRTFSGAASGRGAVYEWDSADKAGTGRMEIMEASPSRVAIKLDFLKPFEGHNTAEFTFDPQGDSTNVTWAMYGPSAYIHKLMSLFFSMDKIVGKDFEAGLGSLKGLAGK